LGLLHLKETEIATSLEGRQQARERARKALTTALDLDPNLAVAHSRMAGVYRDEWDFQAARQSADRALAADPKNSIVVGNASILYMTLGEFGNATSMLEQAFRADPLSAAGRNNIMITYINLGRIDEAEELARKTIALMPENGDAYTMLATILIIRGRVDEARGPDARGTELLGLGEYGRLQSAATIEHAAGNKAPSDAATIEFEKQFGEQDPLGAARIRAWRGENDAAFAWLDKCVSARDPYLAQIKMDVLFRPIHTDPRWNAMLAKIGLPPQEV
jgi:tetratricopeptide (TPR) repeat protein